MNLRRIYAVLLQEYYLTLHSLEIFVDVFFFPLINIAIFGFISLYLAGNNQIEAAHNVLLGMILWQIIWIIAYSVAVESLWNIWSKNLSNMFIAPLKLPEYIFAHFLSGCIKALVLFLGSALFCALVFDFNALTIGFLPIVFVAIIFALFAFSVGLVALGLVFRYGVRVQALAWSLIIVFEPLSAAFFPVDALPKIFQAIALVLPATYGFELARHALQFHAVDIKTALTGILLGLLYCVPAIFIFRHLFKASRTSGQFARNES